DPARLRLVSLIAAQPDAEACVCNLTEPLGLSQPTVSHHLKVLHEAGILAREQRGRWAYYRLMPEPLRLLSDALSVPVAGERPALAERDPRLMGPGRPSDTLASRRTDGGTKGGCDGNDSPSGPNRGPCRSWHERPGVEGAGERIVRGAELRHTHGGAALQ